MQDHQDYPTAPSDSPDHHQNKNSFDQVDSSIGPSRVSRRQASIKQDLLRRVSLSTNYSRPEDASLQSQDATGPRPDSPLCGSPHMQSPHHPNTPSSTAPPFSSFDHFRSRTRSLCHFEGRPHSPALSTASGVTNSSHTLDNSTSAEPSNIPASRSIVREKHKKHRLRDIDRKKICLYHLANPNARQEDIGAYFGVERSTISKILKEKERWLNISEEDECDQSAKHRPSKFPEIEEAMLASLQEWSDAGVGITDNLIRERALSIAQSFHITTDRFKGSSGWVENFKHRHDIRRGEWLRANKMLPPDFAILESHSSAVPSTPVLMAYDQRVHMQASESQSSNCLLKPSESHEDQYQNQQHVHAATTAHWPEVMRNDVPQSSQSTSNSAMIDPVLAQGPLSSKESDHQVTHSPQAIQHSPEIQPQHLHRHNQHQQHHNQEQQHQTVVYSAYGQTLCGPGVPHLNPTIVQAEEAINLLITFVNNDGRGILKDEERQKLTDIRCALFQAANGLTYDRLT